MIAGLVPCSFVDYPAKLAAVAFLPGCNLRCPYCHNPELVQGKTDAGLSTDSVLTLLERRKSRLSAVVISGGEPTLSARLEELIGRIKGCGYSIKLDTNGSHPEVLEHLIERRLVDYVALDVKDVPARYADWLGSPNTGARLEASLRVLRKSGVAREYRTTLVSGRHAVDTLLEIHELIDDGAPWYLQRALPGRTLRPAAWTPMSPRQFHHSLRELRARGVRHLYARTPHETAV